MRIVFVEPADPFESGKEYDLPESSAIRWIRRGKALPVEVAAPADKMIRRAAKLKTVASPPGRDA